MTIDTFTISSDLTSDDINTIDLSNITWSPTYTAGPTYTISNMSGGGSGQVLTAGTTNPTWTTGISAANPAMAVSPTGTIKLTGDKADIDINGVSLVDTLKGIQERLNILAPNTKLEAEWDELRELGEQYRALEKRITEKMATWDKLNAMEPPSVK